MKREIICLNCYLKADKTENPFDDEHVKFVFGNSLSDFICDLCGVEININDKCCARTIWADYTGSSYVPWEGQYVFQQNCEN